MILWINGAFGAGKTTAAFELHRRIPASFVYDPENVGYFIRKNSPSALSQGDFQDIPLWRQMNVEMLKLLSSTHDGLIIVPMTLVNRKYYDEIITTLIDCGIHVEHCILYASKATLIKRLNKRLERGESWAKQQIDRCIDAFDTVITDTKIMTDDKSVDEIVEQIARLSNLTLTRNRRTFIKRWFDRCLTMLKHIR